MERPKIVVFAGSTRQDSLNQRLAAAAAAELQRAGADVTEGSRRAQWRRDSAAIGGAQAAPPAPPIKERFFQRWGRRRRRPSPPPR